jgi:hypothetical protein
MRTSPDENDSFLEQVLHQPITNVDVKGSEQTLFHNYFKEVYHKSGLEPMIAIIHIGG